MPCFNLTHAFFSYSPKFIIGKYIPFKHSTRNVSCKINSIRLSVLEDEVCVIMDTSLSGLGDPEGSANGLEQRSTWKYYNSYHIYMVVNVLAVFSFFVCHSLSSISYVTILCLSFSYVLTWYIMTSSPPPSCMHYI